MLAITVPYCVPDEHRCQLTSYEPNCALFSLSAQKDNTLCLGLECFSHSLSTGSVSQLTSYDPLLRCYACKMLCSRHALYALCKLSKKLCTLKIQPCYRICALCPFCGPKLLVAGPKHRLKETGMKSEIASRASTSPRFQVETIQDSSPICFHFRV